ncbi:hypothetical protein MAR_033851 [Mya arenaria]|uniref:Uncharacterized protein n=1 Tax=Mya arenaria TaxID=6604 RepID=A0ABY7GCR9_MYAAR|nr:hypothetical protein MAR_033851 [Mya arenaria]
MTKSKTGKGRPVRRLLKLKKTGEVQRLQPSIMLKYQCHTSGGGPNAGTIGLLTDAVISVVGKKACGLIGISGQAGMPMDSGFLQLPSNNVSTGISTTNGSDLNSPVQMVTDLNVTSETYNMTNMCVDQAGRKNIGDFRLRSGETLYGTGGGRCPQEMVLL